MDFYTQIARTIRRRVLEVEMKRKSLDGQNAQRPTDYTRACAPFQIYMRCRCPS